MDTAADLPAGYRQPNGYRQLSSEELALINTIKSLGNVSMQLVLEQVNSHIKRQRRRSKREAENDTQLKLLTEEPQRLDQAEPERWVAIARTHFQEGLMALTRAVAQPGSF